MLMRLLHAALAASRRRVGIALLLASCGYALGCATAPAIDPSRASASVTTFPDSARDWARWESPEALGWSRAGLDSVRARLASMPSTAFMAIVGGKSVFEYGDLQRVSYLASVRKSILSMLYGNYVKSGKVDLDKTLAQLGMDDIGGLTDTEKEATIRDLISARSGVYHPASNAGDDLASAPPRGSQKHGTYYLYSNWDFNAAGAAFERETGRDIHDALQTDLALPLGMQDFDRSRHRKSGNLDASRYPAYHINLSTRDMARIGHLMLREGNWNGRQLIPREWVKESTSPITRVSEMNPLRRREGPWGYGYLWWVWDGPHSAGPYEGAYTGLGAVGQHITVLPKLDLVVVHKTDPASGGSVSHPRYLEVLDMLIRAYCRGSGTIPAGCR
jgi:CubicO group peptidase (beta-lactamase class C family)